MGLFFDVQRVIVNLNISKSQQHLPFSLLLLGASLGAMLIFVPDAGGCTPPASACLWATILYRSFKISSKACSTLLASNALVSINDKLFFSTVCLDVDVVWIGLVQY